MATSSDLPGLETIATTLLGLGGIRKVHCTEKSHGEWFTQTSPRIFMDEFRTDGARRNSKRLRVAGIRDCPRRPGLANRLHRLIGDGVARPKRALDRRQIVGPRDPSRCRPSLLAGGRPRIEA